MDYFDAQMLYKCVNVIEGQKALANLNIQDYPHAKKESRKKIYKHFLKQSEIENKKEEYVSTEQFFNMANGVL